jgi:hypothetical protein
MTNTFSKVIVRYADGRPDSIHTTLSARIILETEFPYCDFCDESYLEHNGVEGIEEVLANNENVQVMHNDLVVATIRKASITH